MAAAWGMKQASANVWAVLADEDPGDSEAAKIHERETKDREAAEYRRLQQAVAAAEAAAVDDAQSSAAATTHGGNKKARNERSRKQRKKLQPAAVANGDDDANTADVVQAAEAKAVGSADEFSDGEKETTSCCRTVIGRLLRAAVAVVLIAFWVHAAAPAHTAT